MKFDLIITHHRPHLDEIVAIWLLRKFGKTRYPGVGDARLESWSNGGATIDGRPASDYEKNGILLVGVGGGRFDEHPGVNVERKQGKSAAQLVAEDLGVDDEPALDMILDFVNKNDIKGFGNPLDLANLVLVMYQDHPTDEVIAWATVGVEARYAERRSFFTEAKREFEMKARVMEVPRPSGKIKMAVIESDNDQVAKFAKSKSGCNAALVIQKRSTGNVQILVNKKSGVRIYDIVQMIRYVEQEIRGKIVTTDWGALASEGKVAGAENWFFHEEGQMLLNGSLTVTDMPPTLIPLERIVEIAKIGLDNGSFEPGFAARCLKGKCASSRSNPCPWYAYGLHRCRSLRFQSNHK